MGRPVVRWPDRDRLRGARPNRRRCQGRDRTTRRVGPRAAMNADDPCEVVVTAPEEDWLKDLCRQLVDAGLAASAHVIFPITSIYRWHGAVRETTEGRAFLRTR